MAKQAKAPRRTAAIEVSPSRLNLVVAETRHDGPPALTTQSSVWRRDAQWLHSDQGREELETALKQLVSQYKLHGVPTYLALGGDYCVTRVVTGTAERVRHELAQLEERSARYLMLGHGPKVIGGSVSHIDARHEHALLTIVNRKTMDVLLQAGAAAKLDLQTVEPALVSLCRLVGHFEGDVEAPVLVINLGEQGVELGITHRGQLLLDYRPAGWRDPSQVATLVEKHLARLQRYCDRYVRFAEGKLHEVYLFGPTESLQEAQAGFRSGSTLSVRELSAAAPVAQWQLADREQFAALSAALGSCLLGNLSDNRYTGPNLMERVKVRRRDVSRGLLVKTFLPAAALLFLAAGFVLAAAWESARCGGLERELATHEVQQQAVKRLQQQIVSDLGKSRQLKQVYQALLNPHWDEMALTIGRCMPDDVWLETFSADEKGRLALTGSSFTDLGIVEFVDWLQKFPALSHVALSGTRTDRLATGPAVRFDVYCEIAGDDGEEGPDGKSS